MRTLLWLQVLYWIAAVGYNVVSIAHQNATGAALTANDPVFALIASGLIYGGCTATGFLGWYRVHAVYALLAGIVISFLILQHHLVKSYCCFCCCCYCCCFFN